MRELDVSQVEQTVRDLTIKAARELPGDVLDALAKARREEKSPLGRELLDELIENARIAQSGCLPVCQDTGLAVVFAGVGDGLSISGGSLVSAITRGIQDGYRDGHLRMSVVSEPLFERKPTGTNIPASVHVEPVPGSELRLLVAAKGAGSENQSALAMLRPSDGIEGVKTFVVNTVKRGGALSCPPLVIGVAVGGSFEEVALLAKRACLRKIGQPAPEARLAALEKELLQKVNGLGIGPLGLGGSTTALAVHMEMAPCHMASLPVAVVLNCHAVRRKEAVL